MAIPYRFVASEHYDTRPDGVTVDLLVVHAISLPPGQFGGPWIDQLFTGTLDAAGDPFFAEIAHLRVAAHFLISRQGEITQYVPISKRAWHAGVSVWKGRERCNDFSVGVEMEGDESHPFEPIQYTRLAQLTKQLQTQLPHLTDMAGHEDIAPGRKWDPGPQFQWEQLNQELNTVSVPDLPIC
ncbi:1,6-anhydro-N-acetylmuramyl-L-alanine amidase AmpD [Magnetococcus sp. PR-3]|uniref:1,6-anhydro-N-acetylmuramyl-L-alanine amidase AmpD n=1 Tax=Magnetococcus sp. PR-3 TaxID=3120355 RepID=UPI002FCE4F99